MFKIPNNKAIKVSSNTDTEGNIYRTKNISLDEKGKIKLAERTMAVANSTDLTNLGSDYRMVIVAESNYVVLIGSNNKLYRSELTGLVSGSEFPRFIQDTSTGTPTLNNFGVGNIVMWEGALFLSNTASIFRWNNYDTWTEWSTLNAKLLCPFINKARLACILDSSIELKNSSAVTTATLTMPSGYYINCAVWNNNRLFIGTRNINDGNGILFEWDGNTAEANFGFEITDNSVNALTPYKDGVIYVTEKGEIAYYANRSKQELDANFPIFYKNKSWRYSSSGNVYSSVIGTSLTAKKNKIFIGIQPSIQTSLGNNEIAIYGDMLGGVYCLDLNYGLYHKYSIGQSQITKTDAITTSNVNTTTNVITVAGATVPVTGTPLFYKTDEIATEGTSSIGGLNAGQRYFTIKVSDTTLKIASTYANAIAGTAIDLTGTGVNTQYITFLPNYDFGGTGEVNVVYPISNHYNLSTRKEICSGDFLLSGKIQKGTGENVGGTGVLSTIVANVENRGYFITPKLESQSVTDVVANLHLKHKKFVYPEDKIIVKYRKQETDLPHYLTYKEAFTGDSLTITAANTFTTTKDLSSVSVGDEMEIVSGAGAGYLAHVTSINESSGTYTVVIDESIQNFTANDKCKAIFQNWTKLATITSDNSEGVFSTGVGASSKWVQFKIELRGIDTTIEELQVNNQTFKPSE